MGKHLIVLHHGLWGNSSHMEEIEKRLVHSEGVVVLNIKSNEAGLSYGMFNKDI